MQLKNRPQATAATLAPFAKFTGLHAPIVSRRVAPGVTVQSSVLNDFPPEKPARVSTPISQMRTAKASATPFADSMRGHLSPSAPKVMTTPAAGLTDRQKIAASRADAQAASQRVDALRKELSDKVWDATLTGQRANPAELARLRRQIERAEATRKQLGKEAAEIEQGALARKSSAVRAALNFPE